MRVYRVNATAKELKDVYVNTEKGYNKIKHKLTEQTGLKQTRTYKMHAPYESFEDSLVLSALPVGVYMLEFESSPKTKDNVRVFYYVSDLRLLTMMMPNNIIRYAVVNATTGQPVKGAQIQLKSNNQDVTLTMDDKGEYMFNSGSRRPNAIFVTTADDKACPQMNGYGYFSYYKNNRPLELATILTDRAIYRPGQTVHVSVLAFKTIREWTTEVLGNRHLRLTLRDANHKIVKEEDVETDEFGAAEADFVLPTAGLTGMFTLQSSTLVRMPVCLCKARRYTMS